MISFSPMEELNGIVLRITYHNEETGWSVLKVKPNQKPDTEIPVTLFQCKVFAGATMCFQGEYLTHPKFGNQFKAHKAMEIRPTSSEALEKYLGSGLIHGVGPKTAQKIVNHFKDNTLEIFEHNIDALKDVPGINRSKLIQIKKAWVDHREIRNVMIFLQGYGVSTLFAVKIYKQYGDKSIDLVQENPYRLSRDFFGIGFHSADKIAKAMGIKDSDNRRIKAAIDHVLNHSKDDGHCFLTLSQIKKNVQKLLLLNYDELILSVLKEMESQKLLKTRPFNDETCYYSKSIFYDEQNVAKKIINLNSRFITINKPLLEEWLNGNSQNQKITLSHEQQEAALGVLTKGFSLLTGGPGCGKTTTTKTIYNLLIKLGKKVILCAPTGRAAQRMGEVIGAEAKTIHRLLGMKKGIGGFLKGPEDPLEGDFLIVDETSMLDISLTSSLLNAVPETMQVLFIGDPDQLPSVGPGNVLKDLIDSGVISVFRLSQIFRQGKESLIITYAHQINKGQTPIITSPFEHPQVWSEGKDVLFIDSEEATSVDLKFLKKIKSLDKESGLLYSKSNESIKLIQKDESQFFESSTNGIDHSDIFKIPDKYKHVDFVSLLNSKDSMEEVREIIKKVHPFSSLHFGLSSSDMIVKLIKDSIPKYFGNNVETQILSPMTRGSLGTISLNKRIQEAINPKLNHKRELILGDRILREGDRIIQKKNNYDLGVFNGDIGIIKKIDALENEIHAEYVDLRQIRSVIYKKENLFEIDLAYAITIHKSQGSEFDAVIIPVTTQHFKMLFRNLIYTGLTRAKKCVVFVGTRKALTMAVNNIDMRLRQGMLRELLSS